MIPERYAPQTYALMRVVFGFVFLILGLEKWGLLPHGPAGAPPSPLAWNLTGGQMVPVFAPRMTPISWLLFPCEIQKRTSASRAVNPRASSAFGP